MNELQKFKSFHKQWIEWLAGEKSGREDLNLRPLGPEPSALSKLSYAPVNLFSIYYCRLSIQDCFAGNDD